MRPSTFKIRLPIITLAFVMTACSDPMAGSNDLSGDAVLDTTPDAVETLPPSIDLPPLPKSLRLEDIDFTSYSKDLAKFTDLSEGQSRIEAIDAVRLYFAPEEGAQIINTAQSTFEREDGAVMLLSASGLPDDSVRAQEFYLIFMGEAGNQTLASYGARIKCYRGNNTTNWQTDLCP